MFNQEKGKKKMLGRRNYVLMTSCFRLIRHDWFAWLCRISVSANNNQSRYVIYSLADKQSVWNFELSWEKEQCLQKRKRKRKKSMQHHRSNFPKGICCGSFILPAEFTLFQCKDIRNAFMPPLLGNLRYYALFSLCSCSKMLTEKKVQLRSFKN